MKRTTSYFGTIVRGSALVAVLALGGFAANAQTFLYEGVVYKASGSNLTAQKATVKPENGDAPGTYTGDIVVPLNITYNGKSYKVTSIAGVFKGEPITSIDIADGIGTISRGCFQDCVELVSAKLPNDLATLNGDMFSGCVKLEELTIPGAVKAITSNQIKNCKSLKKLILADGPTALDINASMYGAYNVETGGGMQSMESLVEVVINRQLNDAASMDMKPFRGLTTLETVTVGGSVTSIPTSYFENCAALKNVNLAATVTSLGTNVFTASGVEEVTLPAGITTVPSSTFQGCKSLKKVTLEGEVTSIQDMAFYNSTLSEIALPATVKSIGQMAFSGTSLTGALNLPESLTSLGVQAFANNTGLTSVNIPAGLASLGEGAFTGCTGIGSFEIATGNETFSVASDGAILLSNGGKNIFAVAPASALTSLTGSYTSISANAANGAKKIATVNLPDCYSWGDYAVAGTSIEALTVQGAVGRYVAANCPSLKEIRVVGKEVPFGIGANDAALAKVTLDENITTVKQDAFLNCTALENLNLGKILAIIEADAFKGAGLKTMSVAASNPAAMAEGVFTKDMDITVTVPVDYVDAYKAATGWSLLNIVGDANLAPGASDMGMPDALYYAGVDGNIHAVYQEGDPTTYDVGGVPHTFQLAQFKNRIYGASAGQKFVYSATGSVDGDGQLFYISKVGGETFQAVVLDNAGGNAYEDPFGLYVYGDTLYVNDRNVCIRKIPADAIALPKNYQHWVENNWLGFYGSPWSYGCIKSGWAITQGTTADGAPEPVYWVGMKYNGNGIFRFRQKDVGSASAPGAKPENGEFLTGLAPIFTTFHIDEAHGHMYIYVEKAGAGDNIVKAGLYRIDVADLEAHPNSPTFTLIDGAPVKYEGSGDNEHVGISQLSPDANNEYLYWCYRAATAADAEAVANGTAGHYAWAEDLDTTNPRHQTGIKRLKLGQENPEVELVVPGVEGYGVVALNYEGSVNGVSDATVVKPAENIISYANGVLTVSEDATVNVYNMNGVMVATAALAAGESLTVETLEAGAYIAAAGTSVVKFVK